MCLTVIVKILLGNKPNGLRFIVVGYLYITHCLSIYNIKQRPLYFITYK